MVNTQVREDQNGFKRCKQPNNVFTIFISTTTSVGNATFLWRYQQNHDHGEISITISIPHAKIGVPPLLYGVSNNEQNAWVLHLMNQLQNTMTTVVKSYSSWILM